MPEKDKEHLIKDTIGKEQRQVWGITRRLGSRLSGLMITCGILVFCFGIYLLFETPNPILSPRLNIIFTAALGFIGGLNILCGLLLLLGED